jgi:uncharacterized protein YejL (UPF0352 family)
MLEKKLFFCKRLFFLSTFTGQESIWKSNSKVQSVLQHATNILIKSYKSVNLIFYRTGNLLNNLVWKKIAYSSD